MKGRLNKLFMSVLMLLSSLALAKTGSLFNIVQSGANTSTNIILCLNGKGPLSCENHHITKQNLQITTVAKHYYPNAGIKIATPNTMIKILTPTPSISGCSVDKTTEFCLFAMSNTLTATLQVNTDLPKQNQSITFTSVPPTNPTIGGSYTVTATGGASGNPVVFSIDATSTSGACSISGSLVSFTGEGTCIVDANQAGNANYNAADQEEQIMVVNKIDQTITFTSTPPSNATIGGSYTVTATGGASGNPVVFSIDASSTSGACSMSGSLVSFTGDGTCIVDANQGGNSNYNAATQAQQLITVNKIDQTITFTSTPPSPSAVGGTYTVTATGGASGNPVVFSIDDASSVGACSVSGNLVSFANTGTCIIDANQAGNSDYNAATQVQQTINVNKADQTITFTSTPPSNATIGGSYTVTATGGASGNPVVFSIDASSTSGACSMSGSLVSFTGDGTCIVDANQSGNSNYNAATQAQQLITVNKIDQTITFTSTPTDPAVGGTYTVSATGGASGNPVIFSIDASSSGGSCSISGTLVSFTGVGTCIIDANQAGNAQYNAAGQEQQIINLEILPSPYAPRAVMVVPGAEQVTVSWSAPDYTGGSPITGYTVTYGLTGSPTNYNLVASNCNPTSALSCVVTGLNNNTEYSFKVTASSSHGTAAYLAGYSSSVIPMDGLVINPSTLALSSLGSGGIARVITLTNTSNAPITLSAVPVTYADFTPNLPNDVTIGTTCTTSTPLNANGGFCTITITPGSTASNNNTNTPCTGGTAPVASSFQVLSGYSVNAVILGYGCQYQGGYLFSVDDSTSSTGNIGGSVAVTTPQSNIQWSQTLDSIWGIDDSSISTTPSPNETSLYSATLSLGQTNCNGANDGACNSNNIWDFPGYGTGTNYAAGVCYQSIDSAGNSPCQVGNSCFSDWYLPSICEMDDQFTSIDSQPCLSTQSMQSNIGMLLSFDSFWSSTEYSLLPREGAFVEHFNPGTSSGTVSPFFKSAFTIGVWCVRRLTI